MPTQTKTPINLLTRSSKAALVEEFVGKSLDGLRTPAMVIDRKIFSENCAKMHRKAADWGAGFRAHLKTHKTSEGARHQLISSANKTDRVIVSTLMEAWEVVNAGLVQDGTVKDILYGLPIAVNKIADMSGLWDAIAVDGGIVRILLDHPDQVKYLDEFEKQRTAPRKWSAFPSCNLPSSRSTGFYGHAGNSYASTSLSEASSFLSGEVQAKLGLEAPKTPFVLSETRATLATLLHGTLELHAGNYPMLDLQQQHTTLIDKSRIAQRVRATVVSYYPGRGKDGTDEALIDAGAIAFSKDTGPSGGYGDVLGKAWRVGRISQEHGILTRTDNGPKLQLGEVVDIVGQHACLIAAAYPWYYIVDSDIENGEKIVDVWVPWKGW
ncbi:putative serine dehydratase domain-containing protein [Desarmillaria tabescens]|uniref:Serine dehydratase domain-containing protein n=1 Tax=Armillaria tabescens TaxID=1929756 RepID=A0AA39TW52_ARMTA|nr:putative serine dehydratase domain-containing protein [Desarmillaria tabescens]KAK0465059.1 putative serine dehydratase domain-containing protein [Desarmillaria tabescens]